MADAQARVPGVEARAGKFPGPSLIPALQAIQERVGWLPREELETLSRDVRRPLYEIQGLISFYPHFRTDPPPSVALHACHDLSCWLQGADQRIEELRERYGDQAGVEFTEVSCIGRCDAAPAVAVGEIPATADDADALVTAARTRHDAEAVPRAYAGGAPWPNDPYTAGGPDRYATVRKLLLGDLTADQVITALQDSGLRGMGGAGFPTGRKWGLVAAQPGAPKYVICNADESEPGTFKDRVLMEQDPYALVEAITIMAYACGAEQGYVYIRGEYPLAEARLRHAIGQARARGFLGENAMGEGFSFDIDVRRGAGAYIAGEETALINSIEGKRAEPRNKPPFPAQSGLFGKPTAINNVETLLSVLEILRIGGPAFASIGTANSTGTRLFCLSGCVERPGLYEFEFGVTLRQVIDAAGGVRGGRSMKAVLLGGAAGSFVGPDTLDTPLTFEAMREIGATLGSGVVLVLDDTVDVTSLLRRITQFFRDESCGQCVPCRVGTVRQEEVLARMVRGTPFGSISQELELLADIGAVARDASICGLGQTAVSAVQSAARLGLLESTGS